jgi:transposase
MPAKVTLELSSSDALDLQEAHRFDSNWRTRERAKTLLLLNSGLSASQVAEQTGLHFRTILNTRLKWLNMGMACLVDLPHTGAPRKLTDAQADQLVEWAKQEPLSAPQLVAKLVDSGAPAMHPNSVRIVLKRAGLTWKRTRHSLKKTLPGEVRSRTT